nr:hypothetical protein [Candidatus Cloacimonadota bacterium]
MNRHKSLLILLIIGLGLSISLWAQPALYGNIETTTVQLGSNLQIDSINSSADTRNSILSRSSSTQPREDHNSELSGNNENEITIGDGSYTDRIPMDFYWKNSLFETIYYANEMNNFEGMITG